MRRHHSAAPTTLLLAALVLGCGGEDTPTEPVTTTEEPTVSEPSRGPSAGLEAQVEIAISKLAAHLDVSEDTIEVVSAEAVSWGDTSLGCPQPGMRYAQVITDGVKIVLAHDGVEYPFHAGGERPDPFLCEQPPDKSPTPTITEP